MTKKQVQGGLPHGILRIESHFGSLKPAERKVAEYILNNPSETIRLSITRLAEHVGVSEATIVKFCQHIGYSGYQELKIMLAQSNDEDQKEHIYGAIEAEDSFDVITEKIFQIYNQSLCNTKKLLLNSNVEKCIKMIEKARRIYFFGYGASGVVALDAELKFKRLNHIAEAIVDNHTQKTIGTLLDHNDLVIAISDSGRTKELIEVLRVVKQTDAKVIGITSSLGSPLTELVDETLLTSSKETPFRGSALASRMAQLSVIDVLFLGVATAEYDNTLNALNKTRLAMQHSKLT